MSSQHRKSLADGNWKERRPDEGRTIGLYFKVSPEEMALIEQKMEQAGTANKRVYLRKMAVDGYVIRLDLGR